VGPCLEFLKKLKVAVDLVAYDKIVLKWQPNKITIAAEIFTTSACELRHDVHRYRSKIYSAPAANAVFELIVTIKYKRWF